MNSTITFFLRWMGCGICMSSLFFLRGVVGFEGGGGKKGLSFTEDSIPFVAGKKCS